MVMGITEEGKRILSDSFWYHTIEEEIGRLVVSFFND